MVRVDDNLHHAPQATFSLHACPLGLYFSLETLTPGGSSKLVLSLEKNFQLAFGLHYGLCSSRLVPSHPVRGTVVHFRQIYSPSN